MRFHRAAAFVLLGVAVSCSRQPENSTRVMESGGSLSGTLRPEEQRPLPTDPNVSGGTLHNGVRYVLQPWPNTGRATRLVLVVAAGSRDEAQGERGFLHFVEHVAMDPAQRFGELAPSELLARLGATLDADTNAETHRSNTQYFLTLQSADAELLDRGLAALAGWASQVQFTPEMVDRQRPIVLAELRSSDSQKGNLVGRLNRFLMAGLDSADWSPLGDAADLQAAAAARLEALYRRSYASHQLTVVATGAFDRDALTKQIESHFGELRPEPDGAPREREAARREPAFRPDEGWILADAKDETLPGGFATLIQQLPSSGVRFEQDYQATLADRALCAVLEARLRESPPRGRFECTPARPGSGQAQLRVRAFAAPGALRTSVEAMLVELQRVVQHGVLPSELSLVEPRVRESITQEAQRGGTLRDASQELVKYALGDQVVLSPTQKQEIGTRLLATLRAIDLTARARQWQRDGRRVLAAIRENGDVSIASEQALSDLAREIATRTLPPPPEPAVAVAVALMPVLPRPGKITHSERLAEPDLHLWTLDNGVEVTFKRGRRGSEQALLRGLTSARNAPSAPTEEAPWSRRFAARIVQASGAGAHDAATLSRIMAARTTKIHLGADVEASSSIQDFETTLQLLHLYLTAPRRDPQAFERLLADMRAPPEPARAFLNAMFPPAAPPPVIADQLDLDAALRAHHEQFASVSGVELVIVADLEEDRVRGLVEQYLASLPGSSSTSNTSQRGTVQPTGAKSLDGVRRVRLSNRPGAESQVVMRFDGTAAPSPEARVELEALRAHLRLRLREVLREQLGAIYDADITSGWNDAAPWLEVRFDCKPSDVEKLQRATLDVVAAIERPGISEAGVAALRAQHEAQFPRAFFEERFWLEELTLARREGASPRRILELPRLSAHLTRESMRAAARRHLPLGSYLDAVWSPGSAPVSP